MKHNIERGVFRRYQQKNINYTQNIDIKHHYVIADSVKIRQIIINLISNAVKYTQEGGNVCLEIHESPCNKEGFATYTIIVSDTGIGMSKEFQERIFDSFTRERNTTDSKVTGNGLGMSIVKKIVDLMDGIPLNLKDSLARERRSM